jgi:hypothetical protein
LKAGCGKPKASRLESFPPLCFDPCNCSRTRIQRSYSNRLRFALQQKIMHENRSDLFY